MPLSLRAPRALPLIAPSILSADFARMGEECRQVLAAGGDLLHVDVMDGHFVPNLTMGPDMVRALRAAVPDAFLDVHLMVTDPGMFIEPFAKAGADHFTFHIEVCAPGSDDPAAIARDARALTDRVRGAGMTAGIAINPPTPVERLLPVAAIPDLLLVMSVNPGRSGQAFIPEVLSKTRALRAVARPDQRVQMDGGVNLGNAQQVRQAGCDVLVAASAIFGAPLAERAGVMAALRGDGRQ